MRDLTHLVKTMFVVECGFCGDYHVCPESSEEEVIQVLMEQGWNEWVVDSERVLVCTPCWIQFEAEEGV